MGQQLREILFQIELIKRKRVQEFLLGIGLTPGQGQARILVFVDAHPAVTQKEIADACMLDVTTMSRTLDKLQKQGLIIRDSFSPAVRERDPDCRRSCRISLTEEGREKAEAVRSGFAEIEQMICSGFREEEIGQLAGQLLRIKDNLLSEGKNGQENERKNE